MTYKRKLIVAVFFLSILSLSGYSFTSNQVAAKVKTVAEGRSQTEWVERAAALVQMKDWQGLLDWCLKWTKSEPENIGAWYGLGLAYSGLNRYNDAVGAFRQAVRINPEDAGAWYCLGGAYAYLNRFNDAIEACHQAIRIDPESTKAWCILGVAYLLSGNRTAALEVVQKLRRLDPERADALSDLIVPR
jgi:tetratricopeptide (TPR) repeat protein